MATYCCRACRKAGRSTPQEQSTYHYGQAYKAANVAYRLSQLQMVLYFGVPALVLLGICGVCTWVTWR